MGDLASQLTSTTPERPLCLRMLHISLTMLNGWVVRACVAILALVCCDSMTGARKGLKGCVASQYAPASAMRPSWDGSTDGGTCTLANLDNTFHNPGTVVCKQDHM